MIYFLILSLQKLDLYKRRVKKTEAEMAEIMEGFKAQVDELYGKIMAVIEKPKATPHKKDLKEWKLVLRPKI